MANAEPGPWEDFAPAKGGDTEEEEGPWKNYSSSEAPPTSKLISAAQGAAQGATFGFADEGLAGLKALVDKYHFNKSGNLSDIYNERVQKEREDVARAREANPATFTAGNLGGTFASNLIPGVGIAKGAGLASTLGKAALQGGLVGAGESTGKTQGNLLEDTAKGAALGAGAQGVFGGLAGLAGKLSPSALRKFAEERAVKAAVGPNVSNLRNAIGTTIRGANPETINNRISKMGRDILDENAISALSKTEDIGPGLRQAAQKYGSQIGDIGKTIDEQLPNAIDTKKIASELADYASSIPETVGGKKLQERILAEAANFEEMPSMGFGQAQQIKNQFKYKPVDQDALISNQDASNKIRSIIGKNMEEATAKVGASGSDEIKDLLSRYQNAKGKYGTFKSASDASGNEVTKDLMRRIASPSDMAAGIGIGGISAMTSGDDQSSPYLKGVLALAAHKFARERGASTAAVIANSLSKTLEKSPEFAKQFGQILMDAAQRGPAAMTATHLMLMKNPSYSQQIQGQLPMPAGRAEQQRGVQ